jgi:hypothetical protein
VQQTPRWRREPDHGLFTERMIRRHQTRLCRRSAARRPHDVGRIVSPRRITRNYLHQVDAGRLAYTYVVTTARSPPAVER